MTSFRAALESGVPQLGLCIMYPSPGVVERVGADWDWIWVDGQHGELGYQDTLAIVRACDLIQRPALVRVAAHEAGVIGRVLDMGAAGVIVPLVETAAQARALVQAAKFPPLGNRSYGGRRLIDRHGRRYVDSANAETLLIVQIESPAALVNAAEIAAVPGVDALFFGPDDVLLRRGGKMDAPPPKEALEKDLAAVAASCRQHRKFAVCVGLSPEMLVLCLAQGFHLIVGGADAAFLASSSKRISSEARATLKRHAQAGQS